MDLTTRYLGLTLPHPFMPGASPLVDDLSTVRRLEDAGAAAIVMHSLFEEQIEAEEIATLSRETEHEHSSPEAHGYFPPRDDFALGPDEYLRQIARIKEAVAVPVIASLNGASPGGWLRYGKLMEQAGADAIELNLYSVATDPTRSGAAIEAETLAIVKELKSSIRIPLAVKLSPFHASLAHFAASLDELRADGLVLFNRFYQPDIDVEELDLLRDLALSTPAELPLRLRWLAILSPTLRASLAVSGGIHSATDAVKAVMAGAHAVQMVSALLAHGPDRLAVVRREFERWMEEKGYASLDEMRGSMNLVCCPDPAGYERANYVRMLRSWGIRRP